MDCAGHITQPYNERPCICCGHGTDERCVLCGLLYSDTHPYNGPLEAVDVILAAANVAPVCPCCQDRHDDECPAQGGKAGAP